MTRSPANRSANPEHDQAAAHWRERMHRLTGNDHRVFLDLAEASRLIQSGATGEQVRAWLQDQINAKVRQDEALAGLECDQP